MNGIVVKMNGFAQNASINLNLSMLTHIVVVPQPGHLYPVIYLKIHGIYM